jgi:hypothetical protein
VLLFNSRHYCFHRCYACVCPQTLLLLLLLLQEAVLRFITDPSDSFDALTAALPGLAPDQADQLLTLRGLLACNMLQHCLQKRHNVDFGINRCALQLAGSTNRYLHASCCTVA